MKNIILGLLIIGAVLGCNQKPNFPIEPSIQYISIKNTKIKDNFSSSATKEVFKDSLSITIFARDGDGDLGVNEADKDMLTKSGLYNYIVKRFVRVKGKFVEFNPIPTHSGNFINSKISTKPGPIELDPLNYAIEFLPLNGSKKDTVKFEIQIVDRAKHFSNIIKTDSVLVNELNKKNLILSNQ